MNYTNHNTFESWVEIRVPTYKRNEMLKQCLDSIISQTWQKWRAIIFDDAGDQAIRMLINETRDSRITYKSNRTRLGAAGNLNQCFRTTGYFPDSLYACCLEDDNWIYPEALETNIHTLENSGASIMMRNQDIFRRSRSGVSRTDKTTLGQWFEFDGYYTPIDLAARSVFYTGISNGALFWRTSAISNLQDPSEVKDPSLQEYIRCWQIKEPLYVRLDSALAYSDPDARTFRYYTQDKSFSRAMQHAMIFLIKTNKRKFLSAAYECAKRYERLSILSDVLSNSTSFIAIIWLLQHHLAFSPKHAMRGLVKRLTIKTPLRHLS